MEGFRKYSVLLVFLLLLMDFSYGLVFFTPISSLDTSQEPELISVPLYIYNASGVYAISVHIFFNNSQIIAYQNTTDGGFLSGDGNSVVTGDELGITNSTSGYVSDAFISRTLSESGADGEGVILNVVFDNLGTGISSIEFLELEASDSASGSLSFDFYTMKTWDDIAGSTRYVGDDVSFYARLYDQDSQPVEATCYVNVDSQVLQMGFADGLYSLTTTFPSSGSWPWYVECGDMTSLFGTLTIDAPPPVDSDPIDDDERGGGGGGGSGGGSSAGYIRPKGCVPDILCTDWSPTPCPVEGIQYQTCEDINGCEDPVIYSRECVPDFGPDAIAPVVERPEPICGNGQVDAGESSESCCQDIGCPPGYLCTLGKCMQPNDASVVKVGIWTTVAAVAIVGAFLLLMILKTNAYFKTRKMKSGPDFREYVGKLKDFMLAAEAKGITEKELEKKLKKKGWDKAYIKEAEKEMKSHEK
jgi:hypothetical protein